MEVEYKKDLHHSYMVINGEDLNRSQTYSIKILKYQNLNGILHLEQRTMDNEVSYYFDITAKQSLYNLYEKNSFTCEKVKKLLQNLILAIENAYEYLFIEDDFIVTPEFVYIDVTSGFPYLCYLPGYAKSIQEQMVSFIEYIMNKVDYNDKEAVLLVYSLYGACREEGYTLDHLMDILNGQIHQNQDDNKEKDWKDSLRPHEKQSNILDDAKLKSPIPCIPVMKERLEGEEEIPCYPVKTYLYTVVSITLGITLMGICLASRIIYNTFGDQIDYMKLFALLLFTFCMEAYLMKKIWDKKNQITKIITKKEYINPIVEGYNLGSGIKEFGLKESDGREVNERKSDIKTPEHTRYHQKASDQKTPNKNGYNEFSLKNIYNQIREHTQLFFHLDKVDKKSVGKSIIDGRENNNRAIDKNFKQDFKNSSIEEELQKTSNGPAYRKSSDNYKNSLTQINDNLQRERQEEEDVQCDHPTCLLNNFNPDQKLDDYESNCTQENEIPTKKIILKPLDEIRYEEIVINEFPFFIGKIKQNVDYCLEKDVISRYHAKISKEQEHYYITDLNSRNGTYINDSPLETYQSRAIQIGDIVAFANIKYLFMQQEA